jgi:hypothetical protein
MPALLSEASSAEYEVFLHPLQGTATFRRLLTGIWPLDLLGPSVPSI